MKYFVPFLAALIVPFSAFAVPAHDFPPQIEIVLVKHHQRERELTIQIR